MILGMFRFLIGFVLACLVAAAVKVGFVITPVELLASNEQQWISAGQLALLVATQTAVFAAPFALLAAIVGEWQAIRGASYYVVTGVAIAAAGFLALYSSESLGQPTIVNPYAIAAYFAAGIAGGFAYWLFAGRRAGRDRFVNSIEDRRQARASEPRPSSNVVPPKPVTAQRPVVPGTPSLPARSTTVPTTKPG